VVSDMSFLSFGWKSSSSFTSRVSNEVEEEENNNGELMTGGTRSPLRVTRIHDDDDDDNSSFNLPSDFSLTDHEAITGFPPGTLGEAFRARHQEDDGSCGRTILSSTPSDQVLFPPQPPDDSQHPIVCPIVPLQPPFDVGTALSISTTESEYRNWQSLENSANDDGISTGTSELSFSTLDFSSLPSSVALSVDDESSERALVVHIGTAYRNIAERLALKDDNGEWFSRFTEQDWINFRIAADMVLHALEPSAPPLALPPPVPTFALENAVVSSVVELDSHDFLPETFLCCLCQDAIVGATTLSCACEKSTVCAECWEAYSTHIVETLNSEFVHVETRNTCPSCQVPVHAIVPCHALDVAIFHAVKSIPESLQHVYYARLDQWRREVMRRRQLQSSPQSLGHDMILAELIEQEEEFFWKQREHRGNAFLRSQQALLFIGEVAMYVALASLSAVGFSVLARRS